MSKKIFRIRTKKQAEKFIGKVIFSASNNDCIPYILVVYFIEIDKDGILCRLTTPHAYFERYEFYTHNDDEYKIQDHRRWVVYKGMRLSFSTLSDPYFCEDYEYLKLWIKF